MNNSVYGKTMENVRKHGDYEIVNTPERFQKLVSKPLFKHRHILNEDLVIVEKDKHSGTKQTYLSGYVYFRLF